MRREDGNIGMIISIIIIIAVIVGVCIFIKNIGKNDDVELVVNNYEYFALYAANDKVGVVNKSGEVLVDPIYEEIYIPNQADDVFICISSDGSYRIFDSHRKELFKDFSEVTPLMISEDRLEMEKQVLCYKQGEKYGLIDLSGNVLTEAIYEKVESLKNKPGSILVKKDGLYGVLNSKGEIVIAAKYNSIKSDEYCSEIDGYAKTGYIISEKTKTGIIFGYVDYTGKVLVKPKYESISRALEYQDEDIFLVVMENGKKGVIKNKKNIIKNNYQEINYYDTSDVFIVEKNGKYGFFNNEGKEILETKYTSYSIAGNYIFAKKDDSAQLFDVHGNLVNSNNYKSIIETGNPAYFIAEDEAGYDSIISKDIQIDDRYTDISYAFDNFFIFTNEAGKSGVLNVYTGIEIEAEYDSILLTGTVNALEAKKGTTVDIYSRKIEKILTMEDGIVENIGKDYLVVHSKKEMQYLNKDGEIIKNTEVYPDLKLYSIQRDGKWGFADSDGKIVIECTYDIVTELNEYGFAGIYKNGKWGIVSESGKVLIEPEYKLETYYSPSFIGKYKLETLPSIHCIEVKDEK